MKSPPFGMIQEVNSSVNDEAATAGEACPATTLGITLQSRIERKNAWTIVSGISVWRDRLGKVGKRSTSTCVPKNRVEEVLETKNDG